MRWILLSLCLLIRVALVDLSGAQPVGISAVRPIAVHTDGTVTSPGTGAASQFSAHRQAASIRYSFGLPTSPPTERKLEEDSLPVFRTEWDSDGIRYTQRVLLTSLATNLVATAPTAAEDAVLMVQIHGHNTASEYTNAQALFAVQIEDRPLLLELRGNLIYAVNTNTAALLAVVEVPGEGVATTNGLQLRFRGHMPPGISGAMTLKLPLSKLENQAAIDRVADLDFDEELKRVKRAWKERPKVGPAGWPVMWADTPK